MGIKSVMSNFWLAFMCFCLFMKEKRKNEGYFSWLIFFTSFNGARAMNSKCVPFHPFKLVLDPTTTTIINERHIIIFLSIFTYIVQTNITITDNWYTWCPFTHTCHARFLHLTLINAMRWKISVRQQVTCCLINIHTSVILC